MAGALNSLSFAIVDLNINVKKKKKVNIQHFKSARDKTDCQQSNLKKEKKENLTIRNQEL